MRNSEMPVNQIATRSRSSRIAAGPDARPCGCIQKAIEPASVLWGRLEQNTLFALEVARRAYVIENGYIVPEGPARHPRVREAYLGA